MEKETNAANGQLHREWSTPVKIVTALLVGAGFLYFLAECVKDGLWFVALGVAALAICAAFGALLIWLSNKLNRNKSFEITVEKTER